MQIDRAVGFLIAKRSRKGHRANARSRLRYDLDDQIDDLRPLLAAHSQERPIKRRRQELALFVGILRGIDAAASLTHLGPETRRLHEIGSRKSSPFNADCQRCVTRATSRPTA
jgi:hypothetical protein